MRYKNRRSKLESSRPRDSRSCCDNGRPQPHRQNRPNPLSLLRLTRPLLVYPLLSPGHRRILAHRWILARLLDSLCPIHSMNQQNWRRRSR